jgi:cell division protease FtsH
VAADDLASATSLATEMVREYGLSDKIGPVSYSGHPALPAPRGYSEHTQWLVDQEVAGLLTKAETHARELLTRHREALTPLTAALLEQETITGDQVRALVQAACPSSLPARTPRPSQPGTRPPLRLVTSHDHGLESIRRKPRSWACGRIGHVPVAAMGRQAVCFRGCGSPRPVRGAVRCG